MGTLCSLASLFLEQGEYAHRRDLYRQALTLDPDNAGAFYNLGLAYIKLKAYYEAITALRQCGRLLILIRGTVWHFTP